jgi:hypothetical protein
MVRALHFGLLALMLSSPAGAAELQPSTAEAFERYARATEARMDREQKSGKFLTLGKTQHGEIHTVEEHTTENGAPVEVPGGVVQHWVGAMFMPGVTLADVRAVMQDYGNYSKIYSPDVIASKVIKAQGDDYDIFLRLYKRQMVTVVFNANYHVHYSQPAPNRMLVRSVATRIAELKDADDPSKGELPLGNDRGFLWKLNSYWRFEEADGGVYAECEAISLSRDVPRLLQGVVNMFVRRFPRESMTSTMEATRRAATQHARR